MRITSADALGSPPWWRRALAALGASLAAVALAALVTGWALPRGWRAAVPGVVGLAVFLAYHPRWWAPEHRRATALHLALVLALGLAVLAVQARRGWL